MIDLRSDTVTMPGPAMRRAMAAAVVGDDVYGEDPTVNALEEMGAGLLGMEAALFLPSGTQANLTALLTHCRRGEEYIAGQGAHLYRFEGGGGAAFGGIQPQPLEFDTDGTIDLAKAAVAVKEEDPHFPRTRLFCLENTVGGRALPLPYLPRAVEFARSRNLSLHLDGARIWNAAAACGLSPARLTEGFDSVSACLSKGLGAPAGTLLCGSRPFIAEARRWRKALGGGMRQAGVLAAAGIVALEENLERLTEDHEKAAVLAQGLRRIEELAPLVDGSHTNMVFLRLPDGAGHAMADYLAPMGIRVSGRGGVRLVTHLDVSLEDMERVTAAVASFVREDRGSLQRPK
ncbi:MAG TPA: low-specificity L-threonine aldolase [Verrucomicrobiae bacterium]|nr:low-specificity L-threonine aldolase [Verrucomicrobiae bacterium]